MVSNPEKLVILCLRGTHLKNLPGLNQKVFWFDLPPETAAETKKMVDNFLSINGMCPDHLSKPVYQTLHNRTIELTKGKIHYAYLCCCENHAKRMSDFFGNLLANGEL